MYSYFSKGENKNYLYGCGAPDFDNDEIEDEDRTELPDCWDDMTLQQQRFFLHREEEKRRRETAKSHNQRLQEFINHQQEEGKI